MKEVRNLKNILKKRVRPALLAVILLFTMGFTGYNFKANATTTYSVATNSNSQISIEKTVVATDSTERTFNVTLKITNKNTNHDDGYNGKIYNVNITDVVDNNFSIVSGSVSSNAYISGNTLTSTVYEMYRNETITVTYTIKAKDGVSGSYTVNTNTSKVTYDYLEWFFGWYWNDGSLIIKPVMVDVKAEAEQPVDPEAGQVKLKKTAEVIGNDQYKITFNITGKPKPSVKPQADIVLAIDRSGSMDDKISTIKSAAKTFCNNILGRTDADVKISIVTFSRSGNSDRIGGNSIDSWVNTNPQFTSSSYTIESTINNIKEGGGTNTQAGIWRVGQLLNASKNSRPNASRYVVFFTDGLPTVSNGTKYSDTSYDRFFKDAQKEYNSIIGGLSQVGGIGASKNQNGWDNKMETVDPNLNAPHKDAKFYSVGMFSGSYKPSTTSKEVKFLSTIQNVMPSTTTNFLTSFRDKYITNNTTDIANIFKNISDEIKSDINNLIAVDAKLDDTVTDFFTIPTGLDLQDLVVEGISKDNISVNGNKISFNIGKITEKGATISFIVKAKDPYYSNNQVPTNDGDAVLTFKDPIDGSDRSEKVKTPKVNIAPKTGSITIQKVVTGTDKKDKFPVYITRKNSETGTLNDKAERYGIELVGNSTKVMDFYLRGNVTDISQITNANDMTKNYLTAGKFTASEIVPMDYQNQSMEYSYDNNTWETLNTDTEFNIDKDHPNVYIRVTNKLINDSYWRDRSDKTNTFTYTDTSK